MGIDARTYRDAMARLGAAVNVVTTGTLEDPAGFTASAVCSVTDAPPTLLVCVNRASRIRPRFREGAAMCINVLSAAQQEISGIFASAREQHERFAFGHWATLTTGAPVLEEAVTSFDCRIERIVEVGTHSVMFGAVESLRNGDSHGGLIYFNRTYHILPPSGEA
ncbi:flavin reductase [Gluconacetobacter entanii]|uniref:Flavin reductase n=1 Tax=Gluconacetobacter entanii TaxID=108528 RepID=A0ABT3K4L8_9PROT|nr:flavin reductase [Gluconacetobacter entanii]MBE7620729.1 FMN reductase [Komagataeibacter sp. FXV2]MCE2579299.1 flavin reductase [Komagataeibacter sp. FNDCR1]MBY4638770.1 flavin reductase [Gluconacetobacter entanii]MCW4580775.1 flavin reductase [Gluconacetobacter entanii]MCW4584104.1 flavin reductase [Gluconacetobacter entanii]